MPTTPPVSLPPGIQSPSPSDADNSFAGIRPVDRSLWLREDDAFSCYREDDSDWAEFFKWYSDTGWYKVGAVVMKNNLLEHGCNWQVPQRPDPSCSHFTIANVHINNECAKRGSVCIARDLCLEFGAVVLTSDIKGAERELHFLLVAPTGSVGLLRSRQPSL